MAGNEQLDSLIGELQDTSDPRRQKKLIKQIAAFEDPRSIIALATLYNKTDVDPGVKREAAAALRVFRQMEAAIKGPPKSDPVKTAKAGKEKPDGKRAFPIRIPLSNSLLERLRTVLVITFVLSLAGNGAVLIGRALNGPDMPLDGPSIASPRESLTEGFQERLRFVRQDAAYLRARWLEIQGRVPYKCESNPFTIVEPVRPFSIDIKIYPDYLETNTLVNEAIRKLKPLRDQWLNVCKTPNDKGVYNNIDGRQKVIETDDVVKAVGAAELRLEKWINAPQPTYYPSPTPTIAPPTETPIPSNTPIPSITPIPTNTVPPTAGPSPTPAPPTVDPSVATIAPTAPPVVSIPFQGPKSFNLAALKIYTYKVTIRYTIPVTGKPPLSGTLKIQVTRAVDPLTTRSTARYEVDMSETGTTFRDAKNPLIVLNSRINYYLKDGRYLTDTILPPGKVGCVATAATGAQIAALQALDNFALNVPAYTLARQPDRLGRYLNNTPAFLHLAELDNYGSYPTPIKARVEGYIDATNLTHLFTIAAPPDANTKAQTGYSYSYTYELIDLGTPLENLRVPACR
jgi:hypothetical protein